MPDSLYGLLLPLAAVVAVCACALVWRMSLRLRAWERELAWHDRLLVDASHEVRTPLAAIVGFARELRNRDLDPDDRRQAADAILRNGEHVLQLVAGLLDWSRLEAGALRLEPASVDLPTFLDETLDNFRPQARHLGVDLRLELEDDLPGSVALDPVRLRQVLWNLLANALRFTERGSVTLRVQRDRPAREHLRFEVRDTGPGLTAEEARAVFARFRQAGDPARRSSGFGLGLAISQQICAALGGRLQVDSEPGVGSTFWFTVPLEPRTAPDREEHEPEPALPPLDVLLADDGADHRTLIGAILGRAGATVTTVGTGRAALDEYDRAIAEGRSFDAVILDVQMPELDGAETARRLRAAGFEGSLLALTADARTRRARRCRAMGCDDVLEKPVRSETLLGALQRRGTPVLHPTGS